MREARVNPEADRRVDDAARHGDLLRRLTEAPTGASGEGLDPDALHQLDALYEHLDDAGFEPALHDERLEIDLVPCPYTTLVDSEQEFVCRVHSQLIRDTLNQVPGPLRLIQLDARLSHDRCRAHLGVVQTPDAEYPRVVGEG